MSDTAISAGHHGRRYWVVSPNVNNDRSTLARWKELIPQNRAAFMGWGPDDPIGRKFAEDVHVGDVILIAQGTNDNKRILACGRVRTKALVTGDGLAVPPHDLDYGIYRLLHPFKVLPETPSESGLSFEMVQSPGQIPPAIYEIRLDDARYPRNQEFCQSLDSLLGLGSEAAMAETELLKDMARLLRVKRQIILEGPPGTGKTRMAKRIAASMLNIDPGEVEREERHNDGLFKEARFSEGGNETFRNGCWSIVQFHPSYNYEDFVRGIRPTTAGKFGYEPQNRIFGSLATYARENSNHPVVLVIDEINRANLSAVMGELIYALEYRNVPVTTPYAVALREETPSSELLVPRNLYVIGTMNTADRSIGHIDYAVRRRFAFVHLSPDRGAIEAFYDGRAEPALQDKALAYFSRVQSLFLETTTDERARSQHLSKDFFPEDVQIGHSYFLAESPTELDMKIQYEVAPILAEYVKDGVLKETAQPIIAELRPAAR